MMISVYIYTMEYYSAIKRKILPFVATWMDLDGIMLSEINQTEKDKYCITSFTWNLKNTANKYNEKEADSEI